MRSNKDDERGLAPSESASRALLGSRRGPAMDLPALPLERAERAARQHNDRLLIVGAGISVKGRIENCDRLVVEGRVEATLQADEIQVAAGGTFQGQIEVNSAVIAGTLEGTVLVRGRLEITESGRVTGRVRYSQIAIREGGRISGDVQVQSIEDTLVEEAERVRA